MQARPRQASSKEGGPLAVLLALAAAEVARGQGTPAPVLVSGGVQGTCEWPECAASCPPCAQPTGSSGGALDCLLDFPLVAECPPSFECHIGRCMCPDGYCLEGNSTAYGACKPRTCVAGAKPRPFVAGAVATNFARWGPPAPGPTSSLVVWQMYGVLALGVPVMLVLLGVATAAATAFALIRGPDMRACRKVPHFPIFLVIWAALSAYATGSGFIRQSSAIVGLSQEVSAELSHLRDDLLEVESKAQQLSNITDTFSAGIKAVPASCIVQQLQSLMQKAVKSVDSAAADIFADVERLTDVCEILPRKIGAVLFRVYIICLFIVVLPLIPQIVQILGIWGIVIGVLLSNYNPRAEVAEKASRLLRRYGSWTVAVLIVLAAVQSAIYLHAGIIAGRFCQDVDDNVLGIIANFKFGTHGTAEHGKQMTADLIGASRFYVLGDGVNPIDDLVANIQSSVTELAQVHNITRGIEQAANFVCPAMTQVGTDQLVAQAQGTVDVIRRLLLARNLWPYYDKVFHKMYCSTFPTTVAGSALFNALIGFVLLPVLAVVADVDLKRMVLYKMRGNLFEEETQDDSSEEPDPKHELKIVPAVSAATYTHVTRTSPMLLRQYQGPHGPAPHGRTFLA